MRPPQRRHRIAAWLTVAGLALAGLSFACGWDAVAVLLGIAAMVACHEAIRPLNPSAELHKAFVFEGSAFE